MKRISALAIFAAAILSATAQTNRTMSLQDCFTEALAHNLDLQIERYAPQISLYDLYAAYGGYDPAFSLSGRHGYNVSPGGGFNQYSTNPIPARITQSDSFNSGISGVLPLGLQYNFSGSIADTASSRNPGSTSGEIGVNLTQPLLKNFWTDGNRLSVSVAKNRLKFTEQALRNQIITTITAVENAYYDLIYAREKVKVQQQALDLAQKQLADDKQRVELKVLAERGGTIEQDEAQVASSRALLIKAESVYVGNQNTLKILLTDNYARWQEVEIIPAAPMAVVKQFLDLQDSWTKGLTQRPDMIQAKLNVEQQGLQLKYSFNQLFPQLDLTGSYGFNGQGREYSDAFGQIDQGNAPFYSIGAQFSIPLSNVRARNSYKTTQAQQQQILLRLKQLEQNVMLQIDNAVSQARSAWESMDVTRQARVYAEVALEAEQGKYAAGKSTTFTVLQLQIKLTTARSDEISSLADYNKALATLAQQEGSTLERRQIDFKVK